MSKQGRAGRCMRQQQKGKAAQVAAGSRGNSARGSGRRFGAVSSKCSCKAAGSRCSRCSSMCAAAAAAHLDARSDDVCKQEGGHAAQHAAQNNKARARQGRERQGRQAVGPRQDQGRRHAAQHAAIGRHVAAGGDNGWGWVWVWGQGWAADHQQGVAGVECGTRLAGRQAGRCAGPALTSWGWW